MREKKIMPVYTSMMDVILEIADDDQDLPVDDQLVRIRALLPNQAFEHLSLSGHHSLLFLFFIPHLRWRRLSSF